MLYKKHLVCAVKLLPLFGLWFCGCELSMCSIPNTAALSFPGPGAKPDADKASKKSIMTKSQIP